MSHSIEMACFVYASCVSLFFFFILQFSRTDMEHEYFNEILCPSIADTGQKCGCLVRRHQKFCNQCGSKVSTSWFVKQTASPQVCTGVDEDGNVCGQQLDFSAKFCSNCGERSKFNMLIAKTLGFQYKLPFVGFITIIFSQLPV